MSKKGGYYCAFKNCRGLSRRDKRSFFRFPKDPERSKQWVQACERNDLLEKTPIELFNSYRVCAKHFSDSMFLNDLRNRLQPNSVPMQVDWQEDSNDSIDSEKKKDEFLEAQDPIAKILSNCILQKISADEFFKATGICIQEPVSTVKATKDYVQSSNLSDHIYSSTKTVTNNVINIGENTMTIDIDNDNTNSFSIEALSYEDLTDTLPTSMINAPDIELSAIDISELSFMNADDKTLCINKIPESILEGDDELSIMNNTSNTVRTIEATTQTDTKIFKDKLEANQTKSHSPDDKVEKITKTEINFIENKLDETTQTEFSFLKYKLNKRRLKKVLQNKRHKIKELKSKIKQNCVNIMNNITLEQYELLTERFFPKETSDLIKIQLFKQKNIDQRYSV